MGECARSVAFDHQLAIAPKRVVECGIVVRPWVHFEAHGEIRPALRSEIVFEGPPDIVGLVIIEKLRAIGIQAERDPIGKRRVSRANGGCAAQENVCRLSGQVEDKFLKADAGAGAPRRMQQEGGLAVLRAEGLTRYAGGLFEKT